MKERFLEKIGSKATWVAAVPLIASLVLKYYGIDLEADLATVVVLLALFGILNDPNDRGRF